jgi:hypothetical protein
LYLKARAEASRHNVYTAVQRTGMPNEAAFEAGKELSLLYVVDGALKDLAEYIESGNPIVEHARPEDE